MYDRKTALLLDWYRGPCLLNHSSTSVSTRSEIGCFGVGVTTVADSQKSSGRSANSAGEVARISRSVVRRSFESFARPRRTRLRLDGFLVRGSLTAVTQAG